jgi:hypothetical protein
MDGRWIVMFFSLYLLSGKIEKGIGVEENQDKSSCAISKGLQ